MKKIIFISAFFFLVNNAWAKTIQIGQQQNIKSIRQALLIAVDGDSLLVYPGHYHEQNIIIQRSVFLIGINHPVLDGDDKYEIISVKADGVVIDGFKIVHSGISSIEDFAGIKIYNRRDVVIRNNILENTFFGIYAQYAVNCTIEKNTLVAYNKEEQQSGNGIHCWKADSMRIIANTVSGHRDGIYFEFVTHSVIWRNISCNNMRYGLHFMFSNNDAYISNVFENNDAGVAVMLSNHVKMIHN